MCYANYLFFKCFLCFFKDYPSISQLRLVMEGARITPILAVTGDVKKIYMVSNRKNLRNLIDAFL